MATLDRVTITGADNSIMPYQCLELSQEFPFVEWGILASESSMGGYRFPSMDWIKELQTLRFYAYPMNLSLHLCGRWVRELLLGNDVLPTGLLDCFQRVQLNFHAENTRCEPERFAERLGKLAGWEFIFQIDGNGGNKHLESAYEYEAGACYPLFDVSGGAGVLPEKWPAPVYMATDRDYCYHGYAGGLGPQNLAEQIPLILEAAGNARIWIDMETHVRSGGDSAFDMAKVRRCLEIAQPFIKTPVLEGA